MRYVFGVILALLLCVSAHGQQIQLVSQLPDAPQPKNEKPPAPSINPPWHPYPVTQKVGTERFWLYEAGMGGSSLFPLLAIRHCATGNVERCYEGYGARYQGWAFTEVIGGSAATAIYYMCRKENENSHKCDWIPRVFIGGNVAFGIRQLVNRAPKEEER